MKTRLLLLAAFCAALLLTGCGTRPSETATRLSLKNPLGKSIEITLPKNFDATGFDLSINPATGTYHFKAEKLKADASTVLEAAGAAQAQAIAQLAGTVNQLVPLVTPLLRPQPAAPPSTPAEAVPETK